MSAEHRDALAEEKVEALAEVLFAFEHGAYSPDAHPDHNRWTWRGDGPSDAEREVWRDMARALAPLVARWLAEAEIAGQMRHISAEVARGDVPLSEQEELIAGLRARVSHVEAERDEAWRAAPNFGASVYERGKRDGAAEVRERIAAAIEALPTTRTKAWDRGWDSVSLADALRAARGDA